MTVHRSPKCTECPAHDRIEDRIDWLYTHLLPWSGVLTFAQMLAVALAANWITQTIRTRIPQQRPPMYSATQSQK
jgi:hypothetical protein